MSAGSSTKRVPSTALNANDSTAQEALYAIRFDTDGRTYRYHQTVSALAAGDLANHLLSTGMASARVTPTFANSYVKVPAGVAVGALTASYFGWLQIAGPVGALAGGTTRIRTGTKVAASQLLTQSGNRKASTMTAGNEHLVFGFARSTDSGCFLVGAFLTNCA